MRVPHLFAVACLGFGCARAQTGIDPLANVPKLVEILDRDGFEVKRGKIFTPTPVAGTCNGVLPAAWYNNVQRYLAVSPPSDGEETKRMTEANYLLREDEALLLVGSTPPPMAYFSYQTFIFGRYNPKVLDFDPALGGAYKQTGYELLWTYVGDTINSMTVKTTGSTPFNAPMALISTGHKQTAERIRAALLAAGYPAEVINNETLPSSIVRFGYKDADQFLFLIRTAIPSGGTDALNDFLKRAVIPEQSPLQVFRVRPKEPFGADPLPAPVLRVKGTGQTEMDLNPALQKLRTAILEEFMGKGFAPNELDTTLPLMEGYPALQRDVAWVGGDQEGSLGYVRDANYLGSEWFNLPPDGVAVIYGVNHAAAGKATYSSASVYVDRDRAIGVSGVDSSVFGHSADPYLLGEANADKFYVWQVRRDCTGYANCLEAKSPCPPKVAEDTLVRVVFRAYAEPATKAGPLHEELLYDRVIVFRPMNRLGIIIK